MDPANLQKLYDAIIATVYNLCEDAKPFNQLNSCLTQDSFERFASQRHGLATLSPRSRGEKIIEGGGGNCKEMAYALKHKLITNLSSFRGAKVYRVDSNSDVDHQFCVVIVPVNLPNGVFYHAIEADAWCPRVKLLKNVFHLEDLKTLHSNDFGPLRRQPDPYYDHAKMLTIPQDARRNVTYGPFTRTHFTALAPEHRRSRATSMCNNFGPIDPIVTFDQMCADLMTWLGTARTHAQVIVMSDDEAQ